MKVTSALALLLAAASASKLRFFDLPSEENAEIIEEAKKLNQEDA